MFARLSAFVIWSLVAASAVFWALRFAASPAPVPPYAVAVGKSAVVRGDLTRLFGAPPRSTALAATPAEAPSRFKLVGVMAPRSPAARAEEGHGLALIAIDGKPAKAYAVGARVDSDLVLQSVGLRTAEIGTAQGARSVLLELPALAQPSAGVLPPAGASGGTPVPPAGALRFPSASAGGGATGPPQSVGAAQAPLVQPVPSTPTATQPGNPSLPSPDDPRSQ